MSRDKRCKNFEYSAKQTLVSCRLLQHSFSVTGKIKVWRGKIKPTIQRRVTRVWRACGSYCCVDGSDSQPAECGDKGNLHLFDAMLTRTGRQVKKSHVTDQKSCQPPSMWRRGGEVTFNYCAWWQQHEKKKEWTLKVKDSLRALVWQYVHQMASLSLSNVFRGAMWASRRRTIKSESLAERYECSYWVVIALCGLLSFLMMWIWQCGLQLDLKEVSSVMPNSHRSPFQLVFTSSALPLVNRKRLLLAALMNPSRLQKGK